MLLPAQTRVELNLKLHPKQSLAYKSSATELLYGGAKSGGKSHFTRATTIADALRIPGLQLYLFRKHFEDVISNHMDGPTGYRVMLRDLVDAGVVQITEREIRFNNDSKIKLCHLNHAKDLFNYQGREIHVLIIEEATQFSEQAIRFLRMQVRMPEAIKSKLSKEDRDRFPRIIYTSNPGGPSHNYFRRHFVKRLPRHKIEQMPDEEGGYRRQFILARYQDNPSVPAHEARRGIRGLNDAQLERAYELGDWDALVGNFFGNYDEERLVVGDFMPPKHWFKWRSFDWGSGAPFAVYWLCASDGEIFTDGAGDERWFPRGAIVVYREWYGCQKDAPEKGIHMLNTDIAAGILKRTPESHTNLTVTDSYPFARRGSATINEDFTEAGVPLTLGMTDRVHGWKQCRDRMTGADDWPMVFITESCFHLREYLPALERSERDPEDAVDDGPATHSCDAFRLGLAVRPYIGEPKKSTDSAPQNTIVRSLEKVTAKKARGRTTKRRR